MPNPPEIRFIFFDLGKVLLDYDWNIPARKLTHYSHLSEECILKKLLDSAYRHEYEKGLIATPDFLNLLSKDIFFRGNITELEEIWCDIFSPIHKNIEILNRLSSKYPLGLISNTCESHIHWIQNHYDILNRFHPLIYSFRAHVMKPDPEIFTLAARNLNLQPENILFIDDMEMHITAARRQGWQAIHVKPDLNLERIFSLLNVAC